MLILKLIKIYNWGHVNSKCFIVIWLTFLFYPLYFFITIRFGVTTFTFRNFGFLFLSCFLLLFCLLWFLTNKKSNLLKLHIIFVIFCMHEQILHLKPRCWEPPSHYLCTPEPGKLDCVISIQKGVNGDAYSVAISQKVTKNLPVSFYSPTPGFKVHFTIDLCL